VKAVVRVQVALGTRVVQLLVTVKSGVVWVPMMWMVAVPVLVRVTVWVAEALPTCVAGKVREPCEAVKETSGAVLAGEATRTGAALPVRSMRSGLLAASLSMTRVPASAVGSGDVVPEAS
jgi:hypothetical protein